MSLSPSELARALGKRTKQKVNDGAMGQCPCHADNGPSLSIDWNSTGDGLVWNCQAGCDQAKVTRALIDGGYLKGKKTQRKLTGLKVDKRLKKKPIHPVPADAPPPTFAHRLGKPEAIYPYLDEAGELLFYTARLIDPDEPGGKSVRPYCFAESPDGTREWSWQNPAKPHALCGLHQLAQRPFDPVLIVEGEKCREHAERVLPEYVVITWIGGTNRDQNSNWTPLKGRRVTMWPDHDEPGHASGLRIISYVAALGCTDLQFVNTNEWPEPLDKGFDVADCADPHAFLQICTRKCANLQAEAANLQSVNFADLQENAQDLCEISANLQNVSANLQVADLQNVQICSENLQICSKSANPDSQKLTDLQRNADLQLADLQRHFADLQNSPGGKPEIVALGYDRDTYFYLSRESGQIHILRASEHKKLNLLSIHSDLNFWTLFHGIPPKSSGPNWDAIVSTLMHACKGQGVFSADMIRGRGAWRDNKEVVIHLGDRLLRGNTESPVTSRFSKYVYEHGPSIKGPHGEPLTEAEASAVIRASRLFCWEHEMYAWLCAGWAVLAPFCGVLSWRPHLWLNGGQGTGKTTVLYEFVARLTGDMSLRAGGATTESGLRQKLAHDAFPVIFDEAEAEDEAGEQRMRAIIGLIRNSSSKSGAQTIKGGQSGRSFSTETRSMFALASIGVSLKQAADLARVAVLTLLPGTAIHYREKIVPALAEFTDEYVARLLARTAGMLPVIQESIRVFTHVIAERTGGSQRLGDTYGTLLAGAYSLVSDEPVTEANAKQLIAGWEWNEAGAVHESDEHGCLHRILSHQMRVEAQRALTLSVSELVSVAAGYESMQNLHQKDAVQHLKRIGLFVDPYKKQVKIAHKHDGLAAILKGTRWHTGWHRYLRRLPLATENDGVVRFGLGIVSRAIVLPLEIMDMELKNGTD